MWWKPHSCAERIAAKLGVWHGIVAEEKTAAIN